MDSQRIKNATELNPKFRFGLSSILWFTCVLTLAVAWYADRVRLNERFESIELLHQQESDRTIRGMSVLQTSITVSRIYQDHQEMDDNAFRRNLRGSAVATVIGLNAKKDEVNELGFVEQGEAEKQAGQLLALLGCQNLVEFMALAAELGFEEEDFLYTYDPKPGELEDFYIFLGFSLSTGEDN